MRSAEPRSWIHCRNAARWTVPPISARLARLMGARVGGRVFLLLSSAAHDDAKLTKSSSCGADLQDVTLSGAILFVLFSLVLAIPLSCLPRLQPYPFTLDEPLPIRLRQQRGAFMTTNITTPIADQFSPTGDVIAAMAYRLWTKRGSPIGSPEEDWFTAICQIKHQRTPGSVL
jgi:hypothetical protein